METSLKLFEQTVDAYNSEVSDIYKFSFTAKETEMFTEMMIEFAKNHVTEALKQASERVTMRLRDDVHELDMNDDWMEVDKNSILNAYSLDDVE